MRGFGPDNQTVLIFESLMDSRSLFLTANTESIYAMAWLDLKNGPVVVESPPNTLGLVDDFWFRYVTDLGIAGPDKGKGGKFLFLPPDFTGTPPEGYYTFKSRTFGNIFGDARLSGERRSEAGRGRHQAAAADLSAGGRREAAGDELRQRVREGLQHHPCDGCLVLRGGERGHPGGAGRRHRSRNAGTAGLHRHREGHAVRARCADEEDPRRSGSGRSGDGPRASPIGAD